MRRYEHDQLLNRVEHWPAFQRTQPIWQGGKRPNSTFSFLKANALEDDIVAYASAYPSTFIHAVVVPKTSLDKIEFTELLDWHGNPTSQAAAYTWGGGRDDVWIDRKTNYWGRQDLSDAKQLVYIRLIDGQEEDDGEVREISQEYCHLTGIIWREELGGYCCLNSVGDWDQLVSMSFQKSAGATSLVSFRRGPLEEYLAASRSVLVRMFDFDFYERALDWADNETLEERDHEDEGFHSASRNPRTVDRSCEGCKSLDCPSLNRKCSARLKGRVVWINVG